VKRVRKKIGQITSSNKREIESFERSTLGKNGKTIGECASGRKPYARRKGKGGRGSIKKEEVGIPRLKRVRG